MLANKPIARNGWPDFIKIANIIESCKIATLINLTQSILDSNPDAKVIICIKYINHMKILANELIKYNPIMITLNDFDTTKTSKLIICSRSSAKRLADFGAPGQYVLFSMGMEMEIVNSAFKSGSIIRFVYDKNNRNGVFTTAKGISHALESLKIRYSTTTHGYDM